jgi:hypothetical protein
MGSGLDALGEGHEVAVGDALAEQQVFQRRDGGVVIVQEQLAGLEGSGVVGGRSDQHCPSMM